MESPDKFPAMDRIGACRLPPAAKTSDLLLAEWVIRLFGAVIIVGGVPCNLIAAYIQGTEKSNRATTRFLMVCLALTDSGVILLAVVRYWVTETFALDVRDLHPLICHFHQPVVATVSDVAVYTLCAIAVERFISVAFPYRVQQILTRRNFGLAFGAMVLVMLAKNMPLSFFLHTTKCYRLLNASLMVQNSSDLEDLLLDTDYQLVDKCDYNQDFAKVFTNLDMATYLVLPYTILLFCNVYIYAAMRRQSAAMRRHAHPLAAAASAVNQQAEDDGESESLNSKRPAASAAAVPAAKRVGRRKPENLMRILAVLTVIHIITTLPASIGQKMKVYGDKGAISSVTHNALKTLMFANNATNFLAYFVSSTVFRCRVIAACRCRSQLSAPKSVNGGGKCRQQKQRDNPRLEKSVELPMLPIAAAKAQPDGKERDSREEVVAALITNDGHAPDLD